MSIELLKLATIFAIKVALSSNITADDLELNNEDREYIRGMGKSYDEPNHPNPPSFIASEKTWKREKKILKKRWKKYDQPYAVLTDLYEKLGGKFKSKKRKKK